MKQRKIKRKKTAMEKKEEEKGKAFCIGGGFCRS